MRRNIHYKKFLLLIGFSLLLIFVFNYLNSESLALKNSKFTIFDDTLTFKARMNQSLLVKLQHKFNLIIKTHCDQNSTNQLELKKCLETLSKVQAQVKLKRSCGICQNQTLVIHHTFWQPTSNKEKLPYDLRIIKLTIMSFLHTQNLCCAKLMFWTLKDKFPNDIKRDLEDAFSFYISKGSLEIKEFDLEEICSIKENNFVFSKKSKLCLTKSYEINSINLVGISDIVRIIILDLYGGIYADCDVLYLSDMTFLWNSNFIYRWSSQSYFNNAVIGLKREKNSLLISFLEEMFSTEVKNLKDYFSLFHALKLSSRLTEFDNKYNLFGRKDLVKRYNSFLFDSAWLCNDNAMPRLNNFSVCAFDEFHKKNFSDFEIKQKPFNYFYPGAVAYHMHLTSRIHFVSDYSYFKYFENFLESNLNLQNKL